MAETDLTAMDLRGFSPQHEGCLFEIQMLMTRYRSSAWFSSSITVPTYHSPLSPNASADSARLRILDVSGRELNAVRRLMQIGDEVIAAQTLILGEDIQSHW